MSGKIIGSGGPISSGKSTVSDFFKKMGGKVINMSGIIQEQGVHELGLRRDMRRNGISATAKKLREIHGEDYFARIAVERAKTFLSEDPDSSIVIDGIRLVSELNLLHQNGIPVLGVTAEQEVRISRAISRQDEKDKLNGKEVSKEELKKIDDEELNVWGVERMLELCDAIIDTTHNSPEQTIEQLQEILKTFEIDIPSTPEGKAVSKEKGL